VKLVVNSPHFDAIFIEMQPEIRVCQEIRTLSARKLECIYMHLNQAAASRQANRSRGRDIFRTLKCQVVLFGEMKLAVVQVVLVPSDSHCTDKPSPPQSLQSFYKKK
jgi:hypothetical protein